MTRESTLGPEMQAEGWCDIGATFFDGDRVSLLWVHEPSCRAVSVTENAFENYYGIPAWGGDPPDPSTSGFIVGLSEHDEEGNPESGTSIWFESYAQALKIARATRAKVLVERYRPGGVQLTLDDVLSRQVAP